MVLLVIFHKERKYFMATQESKVEAKPTVKKKSKKTSSKTQTTRKKSATAKNGSFFQDLSNKFPEVKPETKLKTRFLTLSQSPQLNEYLEDAVSNNKNGIWYDGDNLPIAVCVAVTAIPPWKVMAAIHTEAQAFAYKTQNDCSMAEAIREVRNEDHGLDTLELSEDFSVIFVVKGHGGLYRFTCADDPDLYGAFMLTHLDKIDDEDDEGDE